MTREYYIKHLISSKGQTLKEFAKEVGLPYTTLLSMLKNGLGGASVDNVIKVCTGLDIKVEDLQGPDIKNDTKEPFYLTDKEKDIVKRYRERIEVQKSIDILLGLDNY